jgi:hypothetical protein
METNGNDGANPHEDADKNPEETRTSRIAVKAANGADRA